MTALVATILATGSVVALAFANQPEPPANTAPRWTPEPEAPKVIEPKVPLSDALSRLADKDREYNIVVFGDSTGVAGQGWQVLVPQWLGETYDREVTLHPWGRDTDAYEPAWGIGAGDEPGIVVWNGSAPGKDTAYAQKHRDAIVPIPPEAVDLVFMNFGHTERSGAMIPNVGPFMLQSQRAYPNAAIVYLKQNPDLTGSPLVQVQDLNVAGMDSWAREQQFSSIPVWDAFKAQPDVDALLDVPTMIHPNDAGYRVWADAMIAYMTPLLPPS